MQVSVKKKKKNNKKEPKSHVGIKQAKSSFIHPQASVFGMITLGKNTSIWPGAVLRGDMGNIILGDFVNIQDNSTLHVDSRNKIEIGDYTLVGHNAILHGCKIGKAFHTPSPVVSNMRSLRNALRKMTSMRTDAKQPFKFTD